MKKVIIILISVMFASFNSSAGVMLEPYAGMIVSGESKDNLSSCTENCTDDLSGNLFGVRAAYSMLGLFAGIDYKMGTTTLDKTDFDLEEKGRLGLLVGYELPVLFRFWLSYGLSDSLEAKGNEGENITYTTSSDISFGVGYKIIPLVSLNLEYSMINIDEYDNAKYGKWSADLDINTIALTVSVPFSI